MIKKKMDRKFVIFVKMLALSLGMLVVFRLVFGEEKWENRTGSQYGFSMGTVVSVDIYAGKDSEKIAELVLEKVEELDSKYLSWRAEDSELCKLNNSMLFDDLSETDLREIVLSDTLYTVVVESYRICEDSDGALDITLQPLLNVWQIEESNGLNYVIPTREKIEAAKAKIGYENIFINEDSHTISFGQEKVMLNLGATGKGYALDITRSFLEEKRVEGGTVSVGGSVLIYGTKPDHSEWRVGIRDPKGGQADLLGYLAFPSGTTTCISTSGDYEKYVETSDGERYHHILNRETGYPAETGLSSVTVVCDSGLASDGLSTACFVLGYEKSMPLLEKYDAEAVFVDHNNEVFVTDGLREYYHSTRE